MSKQIVIFNALQTSLSGGIGRYSFEISKAIYKLNCVDFKIVIREEDKLLFNFVNSDDLIIAKNINNSKNRNYYEQIILPRIINKKYSNAIVHYPDTMAPILSRNKVVITIHDLSFKAMQNIFTKKSRIWKNSITNLSIRKADKVIADTNFTKDEILKYYPKVNENKIEVIYCGFNNFSSEAIDEAEIRYDIKNINFPYILTVSTISPRKNINGLIKAFDKIKDKVNNKLVIAGKNGWLYEDVYRLVEDLNLKDRVMFTGPVNDMELKYLYKNSEMFVYPSFYEGFGLPPLEAMSYKIPCIVSNRSSIPEVVGNAALQVNPFDIDDITNTILYLGNNCNLKEELVNKGIIRINEFSWRKCAENVMESYYDII